MFSNIGRGDISNQGDLKETKIGKGVSFIAQNGNNNGYVKHVESEEYKLFKGNNIIVGRQTGVIYYQEDDFITTDGVLVMSGGVIKNRYVGMYLVTSIMKHLTRNGYTNTVSAKKLKQIELELPVLTTDSTEPYWEYMAYYIHNIQQQYADQLEVKSEYDLNLMCQILGVTCEEIVQRVEYQQPQYTNTFKVDELFEGYAGKRVKKGDWEPGNIPYVTATVTNNGIDGYIGNPIIVKENLLTVNFFGDVFYQEGKVSFKDGTYGLKLRNKSEECKDVYLCLATHIQKQTKQMGSYDDGLRLGDIKNIILELPVLAPNSKQIDWDAIRHVAVGGGSTIWLLVKRYATEILR